MKFFTASALVIAGLGAATALAQIPQASSKAPSCCNATARDFPKVGGDYGNQNYSALAQITPKNIAKLGGAWHVHLEGGQNPQDQQSSVVAVDGVLFVETTQGNVYALDGATGQIKWTHKSGFGNQLRRGVAVGAGRVYAAFGGNHIGALDQKTGALIWVKAIDRGAVRAFGGAPPAGFDPGNPNAAPADGAAPRGQGGQAQGAGGRDPNAPRAPRVVSTDPGGTLKTPITYYDGMIYFGTADANRGTGYAVHADTGEIAWQFWGTPGPGEFGNDSWGGDQWKTGGAAPWMSPAIDPKLGLLYWTFGNARGGAPTDGSGRPGANLFANSLVAIDLKTGKRIWHFQSVHHDIWDMDNVMSPVLADVTVKGKLRHIVVYGSKVGMYYVLDRATGEAVTPIMETPVPQEPVQNTWPTQPIPAGDPITPQCVNGQTPATKVPPGYLTGCLFTPHLDFPVVQTPGTGGGMTWNAISFDQKTKLIYTGYGIVDSGHVQHNGGVGFRPLGEERSGGIAAFDPATHKVVWRRENQWSLAHGNGILTTAGGVMFIGQPDGLLVGMDVKDGAPIWQFQTGAGIHTSPAAYQIGGQEYLAVFAGGNGLPYNSPRGDDLWGFKLGGTLAQAATPAPPPRRQPVTGAPVEGSTVNNMVAIARIFVEGAVGTTESNSPNAMAPQNLRVPAGTTVTFTNPVGNAKAHCVAQFYEGLFSSGPIPPGQSFSFTFKAPGEYFYNDCTDPRTTGKVVVY